MKLETSRFGTIEIDDSEILTFPDGLYGFPRLTQFVLLQHKEGSPYRWLQSAQEPTLAFLVIDPWEFRPDYEPIVTDADAEALNLTAETARIVYTIVTIPPGNPQAMTANLAGPIVINAETRQARQVVVEGDAYHPRHSILDEMQSLTSKVAA